MKYPTRTADVPVTQKMLFLVRDELKSDIKALEHRIDSRIHSVESRIESMAADIHATRLMMEDQNARNSIVMDGLTNVFARQERVEGRMDRFERFQKDVSGAK